MISEKEFEKLVENETDLWLKQLGLAIIDLRKANDKLGEVLMNVQKQ